MVLNAASPLRSNAALIQIRDVSLPISLYLSFSPARFLSFSLSVYPEPFWLKAVLFSTCGFVCKSTTMPEHKKDFPQLLRDGSPGERTDAVGVATKRLINMTFNGVLNDANGVYIIFQLLLRHINFDTWSPFASACHAHDCICCETVHRGKSD